MVLSPLSVDSGVFGVLAAVGMRVRRSRRVSTIPSTPSVVFDMFAKLAVVGSGRIYEKIWRDTQLSRPFSPRPVSITIWQS